MGDFVSLDCNATTPLDPRVADAMRPFLDSGHGNPSSGHRAGREARAAVDEARAAVAACLGCSADDIVFTSGGTESDNHAIRGVVAARSGGHVVTSAVEHPAVLEVVLNLEMRGEIALTVVPVDRWGGVDPEAVEAALRPDTILVTLMLANNEVGTLEPVAEVARRCRMHGVVVHTDAAQAVGKIPVKVDDLGVDLLTVAGHKLYAPKGVGALYVRKGTAIEPLLWGAGHEGGRRAGTENVLELVGLGEACRLVEAELDRDMLWTARLRDRLKDRLATGFPDLVVHTPPEQRLPNTLSVAFPGVDAATLLDRLSETVAASAGAACHAGGAASSHVMHAMGVAREIAASTVRFSVGRLTTEDEVERGAQRVLAAVESMR
jgi:cysteine desulfurase